MVQQHKNDMSKPKMTFRPGLRLNAYGIISDTLEASAKRGIYRYYKHRENCPDETEVEFMASAIAETQMSDLGDVIRWEEKE